MSNRMVSNLSFLLRRRRPHLGVPGAVEGVAGGGVGGVVAAAPGVGDPGGCPSGESSQAAAGRPEEIVLVHGWLRRCTGTSAEAERLTVEVFADRSRGPTPACLAAASPATCLQFLAVRSVLRLRGVL